MPLGNGNGIYFSHPSGGPAWSRDRGYHTPAPLPDHIMNILTAPTPKKPKKIEPPKDDKDQSR